jgi:enoyl-CoA hydratase
MDTQHDIIFTVLAGKIGQIILNRPKALNALTKAMCTALRHQLLKWQDDPAIKAVIIRGEGDRAFCAGGDVRSLCQYKNKPSDAMQFFREEYSMNKAVYHFTKPYISLLDGITMGGGAGVSFHGSHRIATERFLFAMPETAIGFFPDIGAGHFLHQCPGNMGYYLGLTGEKIKAHDALKLNLINDTIASENIEKLVDAICQMTFTNDAFNQISEAIHSFHVGLRESDLIHDQDVLNECFSLKTIEEILSALEVANSPLYKTLLKRSPTSLKVTLAHLQRAKNLNFDRIMQMDFTLAYHFMQGHDFFEGVRAALVDKDQHPVWQPDSLSKVSDKIVSSYFVDEMVRLE